MFKWFLLFNPFRVKNGGNNTKNNLTCYYRIPLPQVKGDLISSVTKFVQKLPQALPNNWRFRNLGH